MPNLILVGITRIARATSHNVPRVSGQALEPAPAGPRGPRPSVRYTRCYQMLSPCSSGNRWHARQRPDVSYREKSDIASDRRELNVSGSSIITKWPTPDMGSTSIPYRSAASTFVGFMSELIARIGT